VSDLSKKIALLALIVSLGLYATASALPKKKGAETYQIALPKSEVLSTSVNTDISVNLPQQLYSTKDSLKVILSNQGNESVSFLDHHSNCTEVILQRLINTAWQEINPCATTDSPIQFFLEAKREATLFLNPLPNGWIPGTYRAALSGQTATNSQFSSVSNEFQIQ
jgi:hypothetical protein